MSDLKSKLAHEVQRLGFQLFGVAPAQDLSEGLDRLKECLARGDAAAMSDWLGRRPEERADPRLHLTNAKSVVVVGMSYAQDPPNLSAITSKPQGRVARFALGSDYHEVIQPRLHCLARWLEEESGAVSRCFLDTGPLLERSFAWRAGLGFFGKNNCLIHPRHGSWFFIGALVTTAELPPDEPMAPHACGDCHRCIDACPTGALYEPYHLNARRCLAYLTIEHRGDIAPELGDKMEDRLYGCDECQSVCPHNQEVTPCAAPELLPENLERLTLDFIMAIASNREFQAVYKGSPLLRSRRNGLQRNAKIVYSNIADKYPTT